MPIFPAFLFCIFLLTFSLQTFVLASTHEMNFSLGITIRLPIFRTGNPALCMSSYVLDGAIPSTADTISALRNRGRSSYDLNSDFFHLCSFLQEFCLPHTVPLLSQTLTATSALCWCAPLVVILLPGLRSPVVGIQLSRCIRNISIDLRFFLR